MMNPFQAIAEKDWNSLNSYLEHGDVNIVDKKKKSLLHYAIQLQWNEAFQLLIRFYIDVDLADVKGNTAFHYAVLYNRLSYLRVLMTTNGNPMLRNNEGQTPLYLACRYRKEKMIDLYLETYMLDMGEKDINEETICMAFIRAKSLSLLKKYGGYESWLTEPNYIGNTPLHIAACKNSLELAQFLLEHSVFINIKNHLNETALFYAVRNQNKEMIDLLLKHGAFLDFKNKNAETIYSFASKEMKEYIEECSRRYHLNTYKRRYPLHYAIYLGDASLIERYLTIRYMNIEDDYGFTPQLLAEKYQNKEVLERMKGLLRVAKIATFQTKL